MNETHSAVNSEIILDKLKKYKFEVLKNITFNPISDLMNYYGIKLINGNDWGRQLFSLCKIKK